MFYLTKRLATSKFLEADEPVEEPVSMIAPPVDDKKKAVAPPVKKAAAPPAAKVEPKKPVKKAEVEDTIMPMKPIVAKKPTSAPSWDANRRDQEKKYVGAFKEEAGELVMKAVVRICNLFQEA